MLNRVVTIVFGIVLVLIMFAGITAAPALAQSSDLKVGVFLPDPDHPGEEIPTVGDVQNFESTIGRQVDVFLWYESISESFYSDYFRPMAQDGRIIQLSWEPHAFGRDPLNQPEYRLERITAGDWDNEIRRWAGELRDFGYTVYFRPMSEMNGNWVTWGGTVNGNTPDDYIPAWRHIHDIFVQEGAANVKFVWSPNRDGSAADAQSTFNTYYPGDAYVDYVGINGYNWGTLYNTPQWTSSWQLIEEVFGYSYDVFTSRTSKPLMISETASTEVGGSKAQWITDAFARLPVRFPRIESITWFNINKETDWRINSSAASLEAFRNAMLSLNTGPNGDRPQLSLSSSATSWSSYADYINRELSTTLTFCNSSNSAAIDTQIVGVINTNGAVTASPMPKVVGDIGGGGCVPATVKNHVPTWAQSFTTNVYATARNSNGELFSYPAPYPGA